MSLPQFVPQLCAIELLHLLAVLLLLTLCQDLFKDRRASFFVALNYLLSNALVYKLLRALVDQLPVLDVVELVLQGALRILLYIRPLGLLHQLVEQSRIFVRQARHVKSVLFS